MRSIELFAGAGGLALGACGAGFEPEAVVEWDNHCAATLLLNKNAQVAPASKWNIQHKDVRFFNYKMINAEVDLVTGGPPCQPFSIGGKHKAFNDARDMWPEAVRAVRETRPRAFVFENVFGLARPAFAEYLGYVLAQLTFPEIVRRVDEKWDDHAKRLAIQMKDKSRSILRYSVRKDVLDAANFGVPQRRRRLFIVGFRDDLDIDYKFPVPTHSKWALDEQKRTGQYWERHGIRVPIIDVSSPKLRLADELPVKPWRTVRDALIGLPDPENADHRFANHRFQPGARVYVGHTGSPLDQPAKALKAGDHGVPGGENMMVKDDRSVRYFTVREAARIQTFPDTYMFGGAWSEQMRQLGNAVPVELARVVLSGVASRLSCTKTCTNADLGAILRTSDDKREALQSIGQNAFVRERGERSAAANGCPSPRDSTFQRSGLVPDLLLR
ncbi:DNA cytosine methyltransferase [Skermanella stibiiresistens]|uniref:DNA cytosine methyltransferase n=1 Tax=Skermanella stibiiresistens TaxID=913326 RepID=UPI0004BCBA2F|nr:DNA cytosine methyltransferase [Skermanella stibiiresistens]